MLVSTSNAQQQGRLEVLDRITFPAWAAAALLLIAPAAPLAAQDSGVSASEAIQQARKTYGPPPPRKQCKEQGDNEEIVVCAEEEQDDAQFRVKSTSDLDPESREALNDGLPRAPDVAGDGIFKGKGISLGSAPVPAYMFDLSELPKAPEGSDADLIAKGEKPAD